MAIDFTLESQLEKATEILRREITNLMIESSSKKLSPSSAKDLVAYIKLLSELKAEQQEDLSKLTEEQLKALAGVTAK